MKRKPSYRLHKATGNAVVTLGGKDFYLGKFNSKESKSKYKRLITEFESGGCSSVFGEKASRLTMTQIVLAFLEHAETYYPTGREYEEFERSTKPVLELYENCMASKFSSVEFKACRAWWLSDSKRSRQYVNKQAKRLLMVIKWAMSERLMPSTSYLEIKAIGPLKYGRCMAPEAEPIKPVADEVVEATLPHLSQVVADMVRFQQATGCRPGEVCTIKPSMVDRTGEVWEVRLPKHKTAYKGKSRTVYCGPTAQAILRKYLLRGADDCCFSPADAAAQNRQRRTAARKTPPSCGNRPGTHVVRGKRQIEPGKCFTAGTYARAIRYACLRAFPADKKLSPGDKKIWNSQHCWAPNRLRHSAATKIRKEFGLEAASVTLGHSGLAITQAYAEQDRELAVSVARRIG